MAHHRSELMWIVKSIYLLKSFFFIGDWPGFVVKGENKSFSFSCKEVVADDELPASVKKSVSHKSQIAHHFDILITSETGYTHVISENMVHFHSNLSSVRFLPSSYSSMLSCLVVCRELLHWANRSSAATNSILSMTPLNK